MEGRVAYFGEQPCSGVTKDGSKCVNKAYYKTKVGALRCGVHSKQNHRTKLKKNPNAKKIRERELELHAESVQKRRKPNERGDITCYKMRMMKAVPLVDGFLLIFPNRKHENRTDGYGCSSLSPMTLGPVKHGQPGLPDSISIENYHQFNKCFSFEEKDGKILPVFYEKRKQAYLDPIPHRHKYKGVPLFSVHIDANGKERRYTYIESRFFYCIWYEKLAQQTSAFKKLKEQLTNGYNLCICGYDAYAPTKDLYSHYCDPSRPFGHELVLYSLLIGEAPWRRYYQEHKDKYEPLSFEI